MLKPNIMPESNRADGATFLRFFKFENGPSVPVYDVATPGALNQLIGYAKFLNREYGNVYYRGVNGLYNNIRPSIMRGRSSGNAKDLHDILEKCIDDTYLGQSLKLISPIKRPRSKEDHNHNRYVLQINKAIAEGLLQHYAGNTRFVDVVDNHWVALWMGLHNFEDCGQGHRYINCVRREISNYDLLESMAGNLHYPPLDPTENVKGIYEYVILIAMPTYCDRPVNGVKMSDEMIEVDLRMALPSIFLRPHSQHALVIRKRQPRDGEHVAASYDMASQAIGILRVRIDRAAEWLGNGKLVTKENMFPSPSIDNGYNNLLKNEIFHDPLLRGRFEILRYF